MGGPRAMYFEDEDEETGKVLKGTRRSASVKATSREKVKERPKVTTRERTSSKASRTNSDSGYSTGAIPTGSEISSPDAVQDVEYTKESKKSRRPSTHQRRPSTVESRPPPTLKNKETKEHRRSLSVKTDAKPEHYGVKTPVTSKHPQPPVITQPSTTSVPMRPRASTHAQTYHGGQRPSSYHAASASVSAAYPPLSSSAYFQPVHQSAHQSAQFQAPPPSPAFSNNYAVVPPPPPQATSYFQSQEAQPSSRSLSARFEPQQRASQYGIRPEPVQTPRMITGGYEREYHYSEDDYDDSYESSIEEPVGRTITTSSIRVPSGIPSRTNSSAVSESNFSKADSSRSRESNYSEVESSYNKSKSSRGRRDSKAMPPPPKPTMRRPTVELPVYDDTHSQYSIDEYLDEPPRQASRPRRPSPHRNSVSYDVSELPREAERFRLETASKNRRRESYYGQSTSASSTQASTTGLTGYNAKLSAAADYLEEVSGPTIPLTAEALKKEQRRQAGGSSRSTKSSGSHDLSDYRGTQTTRTTRSGGDDNVTIEVTGQAKVTVGGAEIHCEEGGRIQIHRTEKIIGDGSQATSSEYGHGHGPKLLDDRERRSRHDRSDSQSTRSRMRSQHSYTRDTRVSPRPQERDRAPRERREDYESRISKESRIAKEYEPRIAHRETSTTSSTWL
ncbi:hypothetical protein EAE96_004126 [Botrytis aclada]|nr:hypothetical protein EAE96_004126 [Botrytis aclada]